MASDYGLNFGFRRSDESVRVSEGRFRTPATGAALLIGTAVQIDPAAPGFLKVCAAAAPLVPGFAGILVQEESHWGSIYTQDTHLFDSYNLGTAKLNTLSVITTGAGTKVWFKNTTGSTRADGRVVPTVTIWDATTNTPALGDSLGWTGTVWQKTASAAAQWMTITAINTATGYVEGVFTQVTTNTTASALIANQKKFDAWGRNTDRATVDENKALHAKLNEEARANWDNETWHRQVAADLASSLDYGFSFNNIFSQYIQTEVVGEFERVHIKERRGLKVFYTSRGGYIDESQLTTQQWELPRDTLGFHVSEHIDKLRADFATTIAELATKGEQRMEAEVNRRVLTLAQTAIPSTSPYYIATGGLTATILNTAIRQVRDALQPDGAGFPPVTIIGRAAMVDKIADFVPTYSPIAIEEVRQRGFVGTYRGANVLVQQQYVDEDGLEYINANELWVLGGTAGKFALYGGTQVKSWDENTVDYRHYRARKDIGGLIHHPEQMIRIVDSSVTP